MLSSVSSVLSNEQLCKLKERVWKEYRMINRTRFMYQVSVFTYIKDEGYVEEVNYGLMERSFNDSYNEERELGLLWEFNMEYARECCNGNYCNTCDIGDNNDGEVCDESECMKKARDLLLRYIN